MPRENLDPFSIPTPAALRNTEDLQELESAGGFMYIKCANAPNQAGTVQNPRLTVWITWLSTGK